MPLFSIIVPVYNKEKYIAECLESVIKQTYSDWEVIIVDDGSFDASGEICKQYAACDGRIKYFYRENHGIVLSRQYGIRVASGQYIFHLDADDFWQSNLLETIKKCLEEQPVDIVLYRYKNVYSDYEEDSIRVVKEKVVYDHDQKDEIICTILNGQKSLCTKAFKAEIVKQDVDKYEKWKQVCLGEDSLQMMMPMCRARSMCVINDVLYNYRIVEETMSHGFNKNHLLDHLTVIDAEYEILKSFKQNRAEFIKQINKAYLHAFSCRIRELIDSEISSKEKKNVIEMIQRNEIYQKLADIETKDNIDVYSLIVLKAFRYKCYWIIYFIRWINKRVKR